MARDMNGRRLHVGDVVMIPATVLGCDTDEVCNLAVETTEPLGAGSKTRFPMSSKQVVLVEALGSSKTDIDVDTAMSDSQAMKAFKP